MERIQLDYAFLEEPSTVVPGLKAITSVPLCPRCEEYVPQLKVNIDVQCPHCKLWIKMLATMLANIHE